MTEGLLQCSVLPPPGGDVSYGNLQTTAKLELTCQGLQVGDTCSSVS